VSFAALIYAAVAIQADLSARKLEPQPVRDLLTEGMLYTMRERSLRTLFLLECVTSFFGIFYLGLMPAIVKDMYGLGEIGLGLAMSSIGVGALIGLVILASISHKPYKPLMVRVSMTSFAVAMVALGFVRQAWLANALLGLLGASTIVQFNTTNTLFQLIAPERLRGRVLSMHMWAIAGVSPIGTLLFGWISRQASIPVSFWIGGGAVAIGAVVGWTVSHHVTEPEMISNAQQEASVAM
jgi:MFS family permease